MSPIRQYEWNEPTFKYLLRLYGNDYLFEVKSSEQVYPMEEFNEFNSDPYEAVQNAYLGRDEYGVKFNPNREYFYYDGYANLVSVPNPVDHFIDVIDEDEFKEWCIDRRLFEFIEDEDDENEDCVDEIDNE